MIDDKCGISNPEGLVYQVKSNLMYAKKAEFPWIVAIFKTSPLSLSKQRELMYVGVGTLIHPKFVVTAAHCLRKFYRHIAWFGEWNIESDAEIYPTQQIEVKAYVLNPSYQGTFTPDYDIAILLLKEAVTYTEHIRPLCLPSEQDVFVGNRCIAASWLWDARIKHTTIMKRLDFKVAHRSRCLMLCHQKGIATPRSSNIICAVAAEDQNASIKEDGTPLVCQRDDGSYVLAGLAAWRWNCEHSDVSTMFLNVPEFVGWLQNMINQYEE